MSTDYTGCSGEKCPIRNSCHRFTGPKCPYGQSMFVEPPMELVDNWFFCDLFWDNKPLKKYTLEEVKQELNVK